MLCNCPDAACATRLAEGVIEARLAACVNILPEVRSIYRWQGQTEIASEVPLQIKTTPACWPALANWLKSAHPYDTPEIIALPVHAGLPAYLRWVQEETRP